MGANFNFNKSIIGGRLTADPELKTTTNGISVTSFTIAVNRKAKSGDKPQTDFIKCQAWRQTAELISRYFKKGSSICVTGGIQTRSWTDNNGAKQYATEVVVDELYFVDSKSDNAAQTSTGGSPTPYVPTAYTSPQTATDVPQLEDIEDDELPF